MALDRKRLAELAAGSTFYKGRFRNLERTPSHGLTDFFRWQIETGARFPPASVFPLSSRIRICWRRTLMCRA